jgi:HAE1 family hydrophobic/amphiphilic exporter-1
LKSANFNFPGGKIEGSRDEIRIRTMGQFKSLKDIESIVIAKGKGSIPIFLRDVATVTDSFKEQTSAFTVNGQESIGISVFKQADSNTVRVAEEVTQEIERLQKELTLKVNMVIVYNQADFIKDAITDLNLAGLMGGFLAFLVLLLFLRGFRSALIITTAIPISILGTVFLMYATGISLNIMSLAGLALGVGMLVDNGIVILENTYRHRQNIPDIYEASIVGADEMRNPVIASTFAHIIVFLPIMFVKGLAGKFFTQLALTISFSLLISILVALMLNPVLETRRLTFLRKPITFTRLRFFNFSRLTQVFKSLTPKVLEPSWQFVGAGMKKMEESYVKLLSLAILENNRKKVLLIAIVTLAISITCIPFMGKEFVPSVDQGSFVLKVTAPPGISLKAMERTASEVQKLLSEEPGVNTVFVNIGYDEKEKTEKALGEVEQNVARITVVLSEGLKLPICQI